MIMSMCGGSLTEPRREIGPILLEILIDAKYAARSMDASGSYYAWG